jgi:NAD(P)-dependent dehydrogenase (short-subunit alcohol dehydrogenase family)
MASVLITGTSTGIGLETALTLGRAGHNVYATMRNPSRAPKEDFAGGASDQDLGDGC